MMIGFRYSKPSKDYFEPDEFGIHTTNGYTVSFEDGEVERILEEINRVKERKKHG